MMDAYYQLVIYNRKHEVAATARIDVGNSFRIQFPNQLIELGEIRVDYILPEPDPDGLGPIVRVHEIGGDDDDDPTS